ncbi:MAG: hypothetical protein Q9212_005981 [Teloschistes hypoglaucus]
MSLYKLRALPFHIKSRRPPPEPPSGSEFDTESLSGHLSTPREESQMDDQMHDAGTYNNLAAQQRNAMYDTRVERSAAVLAAMKKFYDNAQLTDMTIICGDEEIQCHKESASSVVRLQDAHPALVRKMLDFLYTQNCTLSEDDTVTYSDLNNISRIQILLYRLGEMYAIPTLCGYMAKCLRHRLYDHTLSMQEHFDCISLVYGAPPEHNRTLRRILIDALMAYYGNILGSKSTEEAFFGVFEEYKEFREDVARALMFVPRNLVE